MTDLSDIRSALADLQRSTGRIEGSLDSLRKNGDRIDRLEVRVRKVELWQRFYSGGVAVVGICAGFFVKGKLPAV
jgi:hypothetical protein